MKKITFKDYLISKEKLRESIKNTSKCKSVYNVNKYCKFIIGEKNNKFAISLKPNQKIIVEWFYLTEKSKPEINSIILDGYNDLIDNDINSHWSSEKLLKWLSKNTTQKLN